MQTRKRFFERGYAPVAILAVAAILSAVAMSLDSAKIALSRDAQVAAPHVAALPNMNLNQDFSGSGTTNTRANATPDGDTSSKVTGAKSEDVCYDFYYVTVMLKKDKSAPDIKKESGLYTNKPEKKQKGCFARFCSPREPTENNKSTEACTQYRSYESDDQVKSVQGAAINNAEATNMFASSLVDDAKTGASPEDRELLKGLPSNISDPVLKTFDTQQKQVDDAVSSARIDYNQLLQQYNSCPDRQKCGVTQAEVDAKKLQAEQFALQARSLATSRGALTSGMAGACDSDVCRQANDLTLRQGDSRFNPPVQRDQTTFNGDRANNRIDNSSGCSFLQGLIGGCSSRIGSGYGFYSPYQQQQCSFYNGQYICVSTQQQCNAIQQMISGCPNSFTGQQQCGGLMLMLNKCPQGSYNPYNQSNPYNMPTPTCNIQAMPTNVSAAGQPTTLQWQSQNASYAYLSSSGQVGPSGSMTVYPQAPTTYTMTVVGYGNQQGQCQTQVAVGGQSGGARQPTAQISCQPQSLDVGMQVGISFACQNSSVGSGSGFSTSGALSGNATVTIQPPPIGINTVTYGLTCSNQGITHSAQCTVNVNKAAIVLVANPKTVRSGEEATIGWVTGGMDACVISSPTLAAFTAANASSSAVSGAAKTGGLTQSASFVLTCNTKAGATKTASTTVTVQ